MAFSSAEQMEGLTDTWFKWPPLKGVDMPLEAAGTSKTLFCLVELRLGTVVSILSTLH